ncbi:hypothetical protein HK405_005296, partial [Cladochytrium tenue]
MTVGPDSGGGGSVDDEQRVPLLSATTTTSSNDDDHSDAPPAVADANAPGDAAAVKTSAVPALIPRGWKFRAALFAAVLVLVIAVTSVVLALRGVRTNRRHPIRSVRPPAPGRLAGVQYNSNTGCPGGDTGPAPKSSSIVLPESVPSAPPVHGRAIVVVAAQQLLDFRHYQLPRSSKPSKWPQLPLLGVAAVKALRRAGCELPIELWTEAADAGEIAAATLALVDVANVAVHNIPTNSSSVIPALSSAFREVLVIPATAMAVEDPAPLFESPQYLATGTLLRDPKACAAPITCTPATNSELPRAMFVNVQLRRSNAIGEMYVEAESSRCDGSIRTALDNAVRDSGMPSKPMRCPTPGRLASVEHNCNLGDPYGDPSEPAEDLRVVTPGQPGGPPLDGRAVLITASADQFVPMAIASARALRRTGSKMTVEIWARASSEALAKAALDITDLMDVSVHSLNPSNMSSSSITAAAAMQSGHREVFVIGATNFAMTDPEAVFDSPEYLATGSLFWSKGLYEADNLNWHLQQQQLQRSRGLLPDAIVADMLLVDKARTDWSIKGYGAGDDSGRPHGVPAKLPHEAPWFALQAALASPYSELDNALSTAFIMNRTPFYLVLPSAQPNGNCFLIKPRHQPGPAENVAAPLFIVVDFDELALASGKVVFSLHGPNCDPEIDEIYRNAQADTGYMTHEEFYPK